jgi:hypothetical protein
MSRGQFAGERLHVPTSLRRIPERLFSCIHLTRSLACHLLGSIAELKFLSTAGCELEVSDRREGNNYKMMSDFDNDLFAKIVPLLLI